MQMQLLNEHECTAIKFAPVSLYEPFVPGESFLGILTLKEGHIIQGMIQNMKHNSAHKTSLLHNIEAKGISYLE